jgi:hypothetical protein
MWFQESCAQKQSGINVDSHSLEPAALAEIPLPLGTFSRAIIVETLRDPAWRVVDWAASLILHVTVLAALSVLPLFFLQHLYPYTRVRAVSLSAIPPMSVRVEPELSGGHTKLDLASIITKPSAPIFKTGARFLAFSATAEPPPIPINAPSEISSLADTFRFLPPVVFPVVPRAIRVINVGGDLQTSRVIRSIALAYPAFARALHVFGNVIIEAIIDERGNVLEAHPVSGPALLTAQAVEAVSREKFAPPLLNGVPIRCGLRVQINFRLEP